MVNQLVFKKIVKKEERKKLEEQMLSKKFKIVSQKTPHHFSPFLGKRTLCLCCTRAPVSPLSGL